MSISAGSYQVAAQIRIQNPIDGKMYLLPVHTFGLDYNAVSVISQFEARTPIYARTATSPATSQQSSAAAIGNQYAQPATDWPHFLQQACDQNLAMPCELWLSYVSISPISGNTQQPSNFMLMEKGVVDEIDLDLLANEYTFICRTSGAAIQEARIQGRVPKFQRGDQLVTYFLNSFAPNLVPANLGGTNKMSQIIMSPVMPGHSFTEQDNIIKSARGQSVFDLISQCAQDDGYVFSIHNGWCYYGPPGGYPNATTVRLDWGKDLLDARIVHAARRTRNIQVIVIGMSQKRQVKIVAQYPPSGTAGVTERVYIDAKHNTTKVTNLQYAIQQWKELASKEFVPELKLVPDTNMIRLLSQFGPHFFVRLGGILPSINGPLYHVLQAHVNLSLAGDDGQDGELTVELTCGNHSATSSGS